MNVDGQITCEFVRNAFSEYLDGAVTGREMQAIAGHLETCADCTSEFMAWRGMQHTLAGMGRLRAPEDLGLKLRLAVSHEAARRQGRRRDEWTMRWENAWRPMMVQVSAGLATSVVLLGVIAGLVGVVASPRAVMADDEPLGALTAPHYLYNAAQAPALEELEQTPIVVRAKIDAEGRVYDYTVVSGPTDPETLAALRDELMLEVYAPARIFGEPVRGQVLITFSGVSVKG